MSVVTYAGPTFALAVAGTGRKVVLLGLLAAGAFAVAFRSRLPEGLIEPLSSLVREMNCYYSNLIEGHNTHPVDIQRALFGDKSGDPKKRDLQQEAIAHVAVQRWIDERGDRRGSRRDSPTLLRAPAR
jgi:Fic family protein